MAKRRAKLQLYRSDADGSHRWRLVAGNGEKIIPPEGHTTETKALEIARKVISGGYSDAVIEFLDHDPAATVVGVEAAVALEPDDTGVDLEPAQFIGTDLPGEAGE